MISIKADFGIHQETFKRFADGAAGHFELGRFSALTLETQQSLDGNSNQSRGFKFKILFFFISSPLFPAAGFALVRARLLSSAAFCFRFFSVFS